MCVNTLILVLLIRTMELVLILFVGLQVLPSITPVLTGTAANNFWPNVKT